MDKSNTTLTTDNSKGDVLTFPQVTVNLTSAEIGSAEYVQITIDGKVKGSIRVIA